MSEEISSSVGQMSLRYTSPSPLLPRPNGSFVRSTLTRPASAKATTSGGDIRKLARILWWTRASKLRFPESTLAATRSLSLRVASMRGSSGPELPMQVVQP
jgi:hypothetical protein